MPNTCAEAIRNARAAVDIDKRGNDWIVRHIDSTTIHEGPSMDYYRARSECRRARIKHCLIAFGWDDMAAEYAAHVADGAGRFEAVVSLLHKKPLDGWPDLDVETGRGDPAPFFLESTK